MEVCGAERSQPMATGGKSPGVENGSITQDPLPWVATSCRSERMARSSPYEVGGGRFAGSTNRLFISALSCCE
jgi:hypothetical protein